MQSGCDGDGDALPLFGFGLGLPTSGRGEAVILGFAVVFRFSPGCSQPAGFFHPVEGGEEGAGFYLERPLGDLFNAAGDAQSVERFEREGAQDQEIERALQEIRGLGRRVAHVGILY